MKAKTELHQTVIDRCLKSLVQKQLIKSVKGVKVYRGLFYFICVYSPPLKYPTRRIYMMAHLEPSVELTGGPWYTDNELDTDFIRLLCSACLRFIRDRVRIFLLDGAERLTSNHRRHSRNKNTRRMLHHHSPCTLYLAPPRIRIHRRSLPSSARVKLPRLSSARNM